jgi:hypothetical protein
VLKKSDLSNLCLILLYHAVKVGIKVTAAMFVVGLIRDCYGNLAVGDTASGP